MITTIILLPDQGLEKVMALTEALQQGNTVALNLGCQAENKRDLYQLLAPSKETHTGIHLASAIKKFCY